MTGFETFILIFLIIGVMLECIAMYLHKKMYGNLDFDWEPTYVKFIEGVFCWYIVFPRVIYDYIMWRKANG